MMSYYRAPPAARVACLYWVFAISVASLAIRVLLVPEAVVVADEYYYAKTVQLWYSGQEQTRQIASLPGRGEAGFPNSLYFFLYQIVFAFGDNFYIVAKLLNVAFAALMAIGVRRVARHLVGEAAALSIAALVLWLPASSYYCYFMAEPLYECLVWWGIALFLDLIEYRRIAAFAVLGACLGAALLAKPNAAALLVAANALALTFAWRFPAGAERWRGVVLCAVAADAAFLAAAYALNVLTTGHLAWDPVGRFYQTGLSKMDELSGSRSFLYTTLKYLTAYIFAVVLVFGAPLTAMWAGRRSMTSNVKVYAASAIALLGIAALLLGSVKAAVNWERVYENHLGAYSTRYMSVLFPLLVIIFVRVLPDAAANRSARRLAGLVLAAIAVGFAIMFRTMGNTFQMREVFWPAFPHPSGYLIGVAVLVSVTLYHGLAAHPHGRVYAAVLAVWSIGAATTLTAVDAIEATRGPAHRFAAIARVTEGLIKPAWLDRGSIVSSDRRGAILFMFRFPGIVPLRLVDAAEPLVREAAMPGTPWAIYLGAARPERTAGCVAMASAVLCIADPLAGYSAGGGGS